MCTLLFLDEMKRHLDMKTSDNDAELMDFMASATEAVEHVVGHITIKTFIEKQAGGNDIAPFQAPILEVMSIVSWNTGGTESYAPADVVIDAASNKIYRADGHPFEQGPYRVTYKAGRTSAKQSYRDAGKLIAGHMWTTQRGGQVVRFPGTEDVVPIPGLGYSVPRRALELLTHDRRDRVVVA